MPLVTVGVREARERLKDLINGKDLVCITRDGVPVAGLVGPLQLQLIRVVDAAGDLERLLQQYPDIP